MTTYSLHGFAVDYDAYGRFLGVAPTTLTFTDLDGGSATFHYGIPNLPMDSNDLPYGYLYKGVHSIAIEGVGTLSGTAGVFVRYQFGEIHWSNKTTYVFRYADESSTDGSASVHTFVLGGAPLPPMTTRNEIASFDSTHPTATRAAAGSGYASGDMIDITKIPGITVSEDDLIALQDGDTLTGGKGNDTIVYYGGLATIDGGSGSDTLSFAYDRISDVQTFTVNSDGSVTLGLFLPIHDAVTVTGVETFEFAGSAQTFTLAELSDAVRGPVVLAIGAPGPDSLIGGGNDDRLLGRDGADTLNGQDGNDLLLGDGLQAGRFPQIEASVYRLYQATLGREPDAAGFLDWADRIGTSAISVGQAAAGFVGSVEFQAVYGALDNTAFVTLLYRNVLNRAPDDAGLASWLVALDGGASRSSVVLGFSDSAEFMAATAAKAAAYASATDPASWSGAVYRLYLATLGREPDAGGFVSWSARLAAGADVTAVTSGFVASPEFQARYGALDDSGFVTLLYRNVLGRDPDSAGLQSWADSLAAGTSRAAVVRGFSDSPEFIARTEAAQASWMRSAAADDSLVGGAGDDFLAGGAGADTFTFDVSDTGQDVVLDLEPWDTLRFTGFGYLDGADARLYLSQSGSDVLFSDNGVQVLIRDWQMSEITDQMLAI